MADTSEASPTFRTTTLTPRANCREIGEDLRHADEVQQVLMLVRDRKESVSSMNMGAEELLLDDPIVAFWTDDETYAEYLFSSFEMAWARAIPARQRLKELDK